ncbi:hypothetical protein [Cryobacterium adonitolivorans]|uniref:hypothetical protein n=1 Tax=Cryobacterium adonitolivorans TaxID=1259189 RepID=UPI00141BCDCA|nr:hypothetical protein [Cryobacterium adonitolivorans]
MKANPGSDGEYTDSEPETGSPESTLDETEVEGEYTDSDSPNESSPDTRSSGR